MMLATQHHIYSSDKWSFKHRLPGQVSVDIDLDWDFELSDGRRSTEPAMRPLLEEFKTFLAAAIEAPEDGLRMSEGSLFATHTGLVELFRFMVARGIATLRDLTSNDSWIYADQLEDAYLDGEQGPGRARDFTHASAYKLLHPLTQIYTLRNALARFNVQAPIEPPFEGRTAFDVVSNYLGLERGGSLSPIPDDIAITVLSRAATWVTVGAQDVLALQAQVVSLLQSLPRNGARRAAALREVHELIERYAFRADPHTGEPWHPSLEEHIRVTRAGEHATRRGVLALRRMVLDLGAACAICIQGTTGMRAHELLGLQVRSGSSVVGKQLSSDSMVEVLSIRGLSGKRSISDHVWVAGIRPAGSSTIPLPLVALDVLKKLNEPWAALCGRPDLMLAFRTQRSFPSKSSDVSRMTSASLTHAQREFAIGALLHAGRSQDEAADGSRMVRGQRWRKNFAQFVFRASPKLLPALQTHYRHMSELVTDEGYIGSDAALLDDLESERVQGTAQTLLSISMGAKVGAGSVQRLIKKYGHELEGQISRMPGDSDLERAIHFVEANDVRIWTGDYASCFIGILPEASRCNSNAAMSPALVGPNYALRSPGICAACRCCLILPEHKGFWETRLAENLSLSEKEERAGRVSRLTQKRVTQSRAVVAALSRTSTSSCDHDEIVSRSPPTA